MILSNAEIESIVNERTRFAMKPECVFRNDKFVLVKWTGDGEWKGPKKGVTAGKPFVTRFDMKDLLEASNSLEVAPLNSDQVYDVATDGPLTVIKLRELIQQEQLKTR